MAFALKISILLLAITMAMAITITMRAIPELDPKLKPSSSLHHSGQDPEPKGTHVPLLTPSKRISRFLAVNTTNPRATVHCKKDNIICSILVGGSGRDRCCQNTCVDVLTSRNNCGACKKKCKFTETCRRGQCVMTAFDKRHCGKCNDRCPAGQLCVYGMCNYG
ncbi:hypothetical protein SAY86_011827 [Trapa natans]|uniref:Stigma-specific STIG1-like protein 1 n=1 Tax=Trapa natans TaxID=22666 RepID=A0AAN7RCA8_TRANT|nr:hypothetical protein SAY86_011827 [Trapa natans]